MPTHLTELFGIGEVLATKIIAHTGPLDRFANWHHFASYTGTVPIEASSGENTRHRLPRADNRQLNHAVHLKAICQIRHDTDGRRYFLTKLAQGQDPTRWAGLTCPR
jgi:transposase